MPLYVRFGVDSSAALRMLTRGVRSRDVAVRVASAAGQAGIQEDSIPAWLAEQGIANWSELFHARPPDVLDLLDVVSESQTDLMRTILEGREIRLDLENRLPVGPVEVVVALQDDGVPLVELRDQTGAKLSILPARQQADMRAILDTGLELSAWIQPDGVLALRITEPSPP